jgi:hypothetical protein
VTPKLAVTITELSLPANRSCCLLISVCHLLIEANAGKNE